MDSIISNIFGDDIDRLKKRGNSKKIARLLSTSNDATTRLKAAEALGEIKDVKVTLHLVAQLNDPDSLVRAKVAEALDNLGWNPTNDTERCRYFVAKGDWRRVLECGPVAVSIVWDRLFDSDEDVKHAAIEVLGRLKDSEVVTPLATMLNDPEQSKFHSVAVRALCRLGERGNVAIISILKRTDELCPSSYRYDICLKEILRGLASGVDDLDLNLDNRALICDTLEQIVKRRHPSNYPDIISLANSCLDKLRIGRSIHNLKEPDKSTIEMLISTLTSPNLDARVSSAEKLRKLGWEPDQSGAGIQYLIALCKWEDLIRIGVPAIDPLIAVLKSGDGYRRLYAAYVLGNIGHPSAVGPLIEVLAAERDGKLRHESIVALANIGPPAVRGIINAATNVESNYTMRSSTEEVLKRMGIRAIQPLIDVLLDGNPPELALAVKVINQIDDLSVIEILPKIGKPAIRSLITGLESEESKVRANAAEVLDKIGWKPEARKPELLYAMAKRQLDKSRVQDSKSRCDLEELTLILRYSDDESIRVSAVESLGEIVVALGETVYDEITDPLICALKDWYDSVRIAAAKALGYVHSSSAIEALVTLLDDDVFFSGQVSESLMNIGTDAQKPLIAAISADKWDDIHGYKNAIRVLGRIGDSRCIEAVLRACFHHPGVAYIDTETSSRLLALSEFPFYLWEITLEAARIHDVYGLDDVYISYEESDEAINALCRIVSPLTSNLLHLVSEKHISKNYKSLDINVMKQRDRALAELSRRGNPAYQPDAFVKNV